MATYDQQINFFVTRIFADVMTDVIAHIIQRLYDILVYYHMTSECFFFTSLTFTFKSLAR
jgi:hypothetical protein